MMKAAYWPQVYRIRLERHSSQSRRAKQVIIFPMLLALIAMRLLEWMFFIGLAGSTVVILISFYEDGKELFGKDDI